MTLGSLFHWAPADRRPAIRAEGLRPASPRTVASAPLSYICLAPDPGRGWALSGGVDWVDDIASWDLWQVRLAVEDEVRIRAEFGPEIYEVNVYNPIPANRCWWVAERSRPNEP